MLTLYDEFAGWGGSSQGATAVPGVELMLAANHNQLAVDVHELNFPNADHFRGDVVEEHIDRFPRADLFWASPACPPWTDARGKRRDFDKSTQGVLFGQDGPDPDTARARSLMEEIPRYLGAIALRSSEPVLGGVVENVIQCRQWDQWRRWIGEIRALGYRTRVIALNSMHAQPVRTRRAPQSRDRLYVAYWLDRLGRDPDWDKWLRPPAWCPTCDEPVSALQVFKRQGVDMGRYGVRHGQYYYRCPSRACRHAVVDPDVLPAAAAIDWTLSLGERIGERAQPLVPNTLARIAAGLRLHAGPMLAPAGGTWRTRAQPLDQPMPARTSTESDALVVPLLRGSTPRPATTTPLTPLAAGGEHHALVVRNNTARAGNSGYLSTPVGEPLRALTAAGHQSLVSWVYAYDTGSLRPVSGPLPTQTTREGDALLTADREPVRVEDCTFRMLAAHEIAAGMAFAPDYKVLGGRTDRIAGYGRAVTPPTAEVLMSALVEAITGEDIPQTTAA